MIIFCEVDFGTHKLKKHSIKFYFDKLFYAYIHIFNLDISRYLEMLIFKKSYWRCNQNVKVIETLTEGKEESKNPSLSQWKKERRELNCKSNFDFTINFEFNCIVSKY